MRSDVGGFSGSASGRLRGCLLGSIPEQAVMVALRRTPRTVYRVYEEQEYLAGTDALSGWDLSSPPRVSRELLIRRIAGVAALTGAFGTLGGLIVADVLPARQADLQIADHGVLPRAARPVMGASMSGHPGEALPSE